MNRIIKWFLMRYMIKKAKGGDRMFTIILFVLSWIVKNMAMLVGVLEAIVKAVTGIITLTPTKRDDKILPYVDKVFSTLKRWLYTIADFMSGKEKYLEK